MLRKNVSGGSGDSKNGACAFQVGPGNINGRDNKANNTTVAPNTHGAPFPTGCLN